MKRLIAAMSFAVLAVPALAAETGLPYEQYSVDRALPNIPERAVDTRLSRGFGAPYEQTLIDRALPSIENRRPDFSAASGATRSDRATGSERDSRSPWADDYHFIAPPP